MRPLSPRSALRCEQAITERCRCRCDGVLHGARRVATREALATLPEQDPHHIPASRLAGHSGPARRLVGVQMTIDGLPEKPIYARR